MKAGPFIHLCSVEGCGAWGSYGWRRAPGQETEWRCYTHLWPDFMPPPAEAERPRIHENPLETPLTFRKPAQGRLL